MARVIVLEDEPFLLEELADFLGERGHRVTAVPTAAAFRAAWAPGSFDIALIDRGLPDGDGLDLVAEVRAAGCGLWIIILTARGELDERVSGLGRGADHYLVKPVRLEILAATVEAMVRRLGRAPEPRKWVLETEGWRLVPPGREPVRLGAHDFALVKCLVQAHGRTVKRRDLAAALGEDPLGFDPRRLEKEISRLRQKVLAEADVELPIRTVHGVGYAFTAESALEP